MLTPFAKSPKTLAQQVTSLESRGMIIGDQEQAKFHLKHLSYYRLRTYWQPFELGTNNNQFRSGTKFQDVLDLYIFDRELRLLVFDAIERIEVSVRSQLAYQLAHLHGAHAHLERNLFQDRFWSKNLSDLEHEVNRSQEDFIQYYQQIYSEILPPIWVVCEVMSFGSLSKWFSSIRLSATKTAIAKPYSIKAAQLKSWLGHLSIVRNLCAHHSCLWNREFTVKPKLIRNPRHLLAQNFSPSSPSKIYNTLVISLYLLDQISPTHQWGKDLVALIKTCPQPLSAMGFPSNWQNRTIWQR